MGYQYRDPTAALRAALTQVQNNEAEKVDKYNQQVRLDNEATWKQKMYEHTLANEKLSNKRYKQQQNLQKKQWEHTIDREKKMDSRYATEQTRIAATDKLLLAIQKAKTPEELDNIVGSVKTPVNAKSIDTAYTRLKDKLTKQQKEVNMNKASVKVLDEAIDPYLYFANPDVAKILATDGIKETPEAKKKLEEIYKKVDAKIKLSPQETNLYNANEQLVSKLNNVFAPSALNNSMHRVYSGVATDGSYSGVKQADIIEAEKQLTLANARQLDKDTRVQKLETELLAQQNVEQKAKKDAKAATPVSKKAMIKYLDSTDGLSKKVKLKLAQAIDSGKITDNAKLATILNASDTSGGWFGIGGGVTEESVDAALKQYGSPSSKLIPEALDRTDSDAVARLKARIAAAKGDSLKELDPINSDIATVNKLAKYALLHRL